MEILIAVIAFLLYSGVREYMYWKQITKLQELTKAKDLQEYYKGNKSNTVHDGNKVMREEEPNTIQMDESKPFDMPDDMKIDWGNEGVQKIKIYK